LSCVCVGYSADPDFVPSILPKFHKFLLRELFSRIFQDYILQEHVTMTISTRNNMRRSNRGKTADYSSRPLSAMGCWVSLLMSMSADVSAFNAGVMQPLATVRTPIAFARELASSADFYCRRNSATSCSAISSRSRRLHSISTRLQYSDGNGNTVTAQLSPSSTNKWWGNVFSSADAEIEEENQEIVDEYLEFLDRRYRRLHNNEPEEEKPKPFSALHWLIQGSPYHNDVVASKQQQEDALYALGVAGLASQKLLQKHHVAHQEQRRTSSATVVQGRPRPIRDESSDQVAAKRFSESQIGSTIANKVIFPVVRVFYMIEQRKQLFIRARVQKLRAFLSLMVKSVAKSLIQGPISTTKSGP
jgi:hypothetical protein